MSKSIILLVDNDQDFLESRRLFLEQEGYHVIAASGETEARRKYEREPLDLAILDIRLRDNDDPEDRSGLRLAQSFPETPAIMLTDYLTETVLKEAWRRHQSGKRPIVDMLEKSQGPEVMLQSARLALQQQSRAARGPLLLAAGLLAGMAGFGVWAVWYSDLFGLIAAVGLGVCYMALSVWLTA